MSTFNSIIDRLDKIKDIAGFNDNEIKYLLKHHQVSKSILNIEGDKLPSWRIVHNNDLGPGKGGIRFHPEVSEDEVKSLSFWMSMKNSLLGLPYGGAKGGVKFNPKGKSQKYLEKVSRSYSRAFYKVLGQDTDIPAPDVYTDGQIMAWILDEYEKKVGHHEPGMITGKPIDLGGIALRSDSTARGAYLIFEELISSLSSRAKSRDLTNKKDLKIAIQGFGNAGHNFAKMLLDAGYRIVGVSDSRGGMNCQKKICFDKLTALKEKEGTVKSCECPMGRQISNDELLELDVDVLILAALENQITKENAGKIKAKYIIELANGPITPEADKILFEKGVAIVPDILANAGGVVVSYFEWAQNRTGNILDPEYLKKKLELMMKDAWKRVSDQAKESKTDYRTAAYIIAMKRILSAAKLRGKI